MGLKVTDIQDKNGQSKEIQDKDLANQTSASVINSTDYVMLQDTSGGYHKISRTSFADAVRDVLGSSINSAAKGTDIAKLPVLDSSNNLGMGTLANVASVLGVLTDGLMLRKSFNSTAGDLNDYTVPGVYYAYISANTPISTGSLWWHIYNSGMVNGTDINQLVFHNNGKAYFRQRINNVWKDWSEFSMDIPSFYKNFANFDSLASALGVAHISISSSVDFNNITTGGTYQIYSSATVQNSPFNDGTSQILVVFSTGGYTLQIVSQITGDNKMYRRTTFGNGDWSQWVEM